MASICGLSCEGCKAVFAGRPQQLSSRLRIGGLEEVGDFMPVSREKKKMAAVDISDKRRNN
jgi:hypothetical protein